MIHSNLLADVGNPGGNGFSALPNYPAGFKFTSMKIGDVLSELLPYILVIAALAMTLMLIVGGITLMTAMGDPGKTKDGYGKITAGVIGFIIIFVSYFVAQILEVVLGVKFL